MFGQTWSTQTYSGIQVDPQFFTDGLRRGSNKTRPAGLRSGRAPRVVTETILPAWSDCWRGNRCAHLPNTYPYF